MKKIVILLFLVAQLVACQDKTKQPIQQSPVEDWHTKHLIYAWNLKQFDNQNSAQIVTCGHLGEGTLQFVPDSLQHTLLLQDSTTTPIKWQDAQYLVIEARHENSFSGIIYVEFFSDQKNIIDGKEYPHFFFKVGILPGLHTQIILPLSYLDGQIIYLKRFPRQLKAFAGGKRLEPQDIKKVVLRVEPYQLPDFKPHMMFKKIYLTDTLPKPLPHVEKPIVDKFGQWTFRDWENKMKDEQQLVTFLQQTAQKAQKTVDMPQEWSAYGGWKKKKFKATGFFRTEFDGKRWWLVDPEGYAFLSHGVDCVRVGTPTTVQNQEDLFEWLPDTANKEAYNYTPHKQVNFHITNLQRAFGNDWKENWEKMTKVQLAEMRLNTIANWSDSAFCKKAKMPYVLPLKNFPTTEKMLYRDFPDVFDISYQENAIAFAKQLENYKDDTYLIGYFLRNEPEWAFGDNNLALEMMATTQPSATKNEMIKWLQNKYKNIAAFNEAWGLSLTSFEQINETKLKGESSVTVIGLADLRRFSEIMVDKYITVPCEAVKKIDKNHLNLGMRYAWISSDLCYHAGKYFDVFSLNGYEYPAPPKTDEILKRTGKPVMIGEFHFGAADMGLSANGIQGAKNQVDRARAYRYYVEQGFARPELIGIHYFLWSDQPIMGRFDGENYGIGLLDITHQPYKEMFEAIRQTGEVMYEVANQQKKPYNEVIPRVPQIFY